MDQYISPDLLSCGNSKQQQIQQQHLQAIANLDFFSFATSPSDILAPHPDLFESELDSSLAGFEHLQLQSLQDTFEFLRADTPVCGPPSTITVSSESASAYDSLSSQSDSFYNYTSSNYSFGYDLDMDFSRTSISARQDYPSTASGLSADGFSDYSYGATGQSPPSSTAGSTTMSDDVESFDPHPPPPVSHRGSSVYSEYNSEYYPLSANHPSLSFPAVVSPSAIHARQAAQVQPPQARAPSPVGAGLVMPILPRIAQGDSRAIPRVPSGSQLTGHVSGARHQKDESGDDALRKYRCHKCTKAFARAFNLKSHLDTHNPHRLKPYKCYHSSCHREFSRKHDLGRHLVSIHRDEPAGSSASVEDSMEVGIGVASMKGGLNRCDGCGKGGPKKCQCIPSGK